MALLDEISSILTASTYFVAAPSTTGVQVWLGTDPDVAEDTALAIYEPPGAPPVYNYSGISFTRPRIQIIARSTSYTTARDVADQAYTLLSTIQNTTDFITISPLQEPYDIGQDSLGREQRSCNYAIERNPA